MRISFTLVFLVLFSACGRYTTDEFVAVDVDFKNVDWYAERAQLAYSDKDKILKELDKVRTTETVFRRSLKNKPKLLMSKGTNTINRNLR